MRQRGLNLTVTIIFETRYQCESRVASDLKQYKNATGAYISREKVGFVVMLSHAGISDFIGGALTR